MGTTDGAEFLDTAVRFAKERLYGTLHAHLIVHSGLLRESRMRAALETAIRRLRHGVGVERVSGPSLADVQSGRGFVLSALMVEHVERTVLGHPFRVP